MQAVAQPPLLAWLLLLLLLHHLVWHRQRCQQQQWEWGQGSVCECTVLA